MLQLTQEQRDELLRKRSYALSLFDENTTTEDVLKKIYIESMENKSNQQAELMAQDIIKNVDKIFSIHDLLTDDSGNINEKLNLFFSGLSPEEKAHAFHSVSHTLKNVQSAIESGNTDTTELKEELAQIKENGTDESSLNKMLDDTIFSIKNEDTKDYLLSKCRNQSDNEVLGRVLTNTQNDKKTFIAVDSMILYTMSVNGRIENVPRNTSLFEITAGVCLNNALKGNSYATDNGSISSIQSDDDYFFWMLSIIIVVCVSAFVGTVFSLAEVALTISTMLIGILCVAVYSTSLISLAYTHFYDCVSTNIFEIPVVKFPEFMHKTWDKLKSYINNPLKQTTTEKLDIDTIYVEDNNDLQYNSYEEELYRSLWDDTFPI